MFDKYSFLEEFLVPALLGLGAYSTFKNMSQTALNSKMMNGLQVEIRKCDPRNKQLALNIVNKYSTQLTQIYGKKLDKATLKKLAITQNLINTNLKRPLEQIINSADKDWKMTSMQYLYKNVTKIIRQQNSANMLSAAAIGVGGAAAAGLAPTSLSLGLFGANVIRSQFKHFNSMFYLNKMSKELEACNTRQDAIKVIDKYCYQISNDLNQIVIKSGKKTPIDIQLQLRQQLANPLLEIINNQNNKYWKVLAVDYVKSQKAFQNVQYVCNSISQLVVPVAMSRVAAK